MPEIPVESTVWIRRSIPSPGGGANEDNLNHLKSAPHSLQQPRIVKYAYDSDALQILASLNVNEHGSWNLAKYASEIMSVLLLCSTFYDYPFALFS